MDRERSHLENCSWPDLGGGGMQWVPRMLACDGSDLKTGFHTQTSESDLINPSVDRVS